MNIKRCLLSAAVTCAAVSALYLPAWAAPAVCSANCSESKQMVSLSQRIESAVAYIHSKTVVKPEYAIVLGSGFDKFGDELENAVAIPYGDIPGFAPSTAPGHKGELLLGTLEGKRVAVMRGRVHLYEGLTPQQVVFPIQVLSALGAKRLIISNASGAIRNDLALGELMIIKDHINMTGCNPCAGVNDDKVGPRFFPVTTAYDGDMRQAALRVAGREGFKLSEGIYVGMLGPSYETAAENRMLSAWGGDAVGMSTVLEIIEAAHCGMKVFGVTCITDVLNDEDSEDMEQAVIRAGERACQRFIKLVRGIVRDIK
ncbi:MAG: purine-nucleoside phosphorylase [bacterium]|nr:purine-nucleoside phosphorylase [bacterium]